MEVGLLGATGLVGQNFVQLLESHPWFQLKWVGASDVSAGRKYREAAKWRLDSEIPDVVAEMTVEKCRPNRAPRLVFSAMDSAAATEVERSFAKAGHIVVSNSVNHRMEADVPLLVPEVNPEHLQLIPRQKSNRGWKGYIVTNPNCSTVMLSMALAAVKPFGIASVVATTMQAISGAGYPGVSGIDITGNVIPFIGGEEEKIERETRKILGEFQGGEIRPLPATISAHCNRVPVLHGHTVTVSVKFTKPPAERELIAAFREFAGLPQQRRLPTAPARPICYREELDRPQPRRDAEKEHGMACSVGRLRPCPALDYKFVVLGHNIIRGAAGAAILNAELMLTEGKLGR
jgi:aspartate-semialdehyde dehydrogenase